MSGSNEVIEFLDWLISLHSNHEERAKVNLNVIIQRAHNARQSLQFDQGHVVQFTSDAWTLLHPLECRPNLFDCEYTKAKVDRSPPELGSYECKLAGDTIYMTRKL